MSFPSKADYFEYDTIRTSFRNNIWMISRPIPYSAVFNPVIAHVEPRASAPHELAPYFPTFHGWSAAHSFQELIFQLFMVHV